jgi:hypothetical protein
MSIDQREQLRGLLIALHDSVGDVGCPAPGACDEP